MTKKYEELKLQHADWSDRLATIEEAYQKKLATFSNASTTTTSQEKDTKTANIDMSGEL